MYREEHIYSLYSLYSFLMIAMQLFIDLDVLEDTPPRAMAEDFTPPGSLSRTFPDVLGAMI